MFLKSLRPRLRRLDAHCARLNPGLQAVVLVLLLLTMAAAEATLAAKERVDVWSAQSGILPP